MDRKTHTHTHTLLSLVICQCIVSVFNYNWPFKFTLHQKISLVDYNILSGNNKRENYILINVFIINYCHVKLMKFN